MNIKRSLLFALPSKCLGVESIKRRKKTTSNILWGPIVIWKNSETFQLIHPICKTKVHSYYKVQDSQKRFYILREDHWPQSYQIEYIYQKEQEDFLILQNLNILKIHEQNVYDRYIVFEYFPGLPLQELLQHKGSQIHSIQFMKQILKEVQSLHEQGFIHKNLTSESIWYHHASDQVKIGEYYYSSRFNENPPPFGPINSLPGNLNYLSPEQTGRMNRSIDLRSDLYSLGIVFYELVTNQLPFLHEDALDLIHDHLVTIPVAPNQLNLEISEDLSKLILKLLEKEADQRYQTISDVMSDLVSIEKQEKIDLKYKNIKIHNFSHKLYGRELEMETLNQAFFDCSRAKKNSVFISGLSGIGKTSLINNIFQPITLKNGIYIQAKSDQIKRNIPLYSIQSAMEHLAEQILHDFDVPSLRDEIQKKLGPDASLISRLVPSLTFLCGEYLETKGSYTSEISKKFEYILNQFLSIIATEDHPLIIFLDDLQWSDSKSIEIIQSILNDSQIIHLLLIGAYRDNEVDQNHPLWELLLVLDYKSSHKNIKFHPHTPSHIIPFYLIFLLGKP